MAAFKVRLKDGVEVGPLDLGMLRSWYEQGMVVRDSPVRASGSKQWVPLAKAVDISAWGAAGGPGTGRARARVEDADVAEDDAYEDESEPESSQRWRIVLAAVIAFALAAGSGYVLWFPERWRTDLAMVPWREISLGFALLGLLLVSGSDALRKVARVLVVALTFSLFPLAAFFIVPQVLARPLLLMGAAWVMGSGLFFFISGRHLSWRSIALSLFWVLAGAAGIAWLGFVPPAGPGVASTSAPAAPAAAAAAPAAAPRPAAATVTGLQADVPLLSARAAETVLSRTDLRAGEGFRAAYASASRGVGVLTREEARELADLMGATLGGISVEDRRRLEAYLERVRAGVPTPPEEDAAMSRLMRGAVLALSEPQRARLQALFEKTIAAGR